MPDHRVEHLTAHHFRENSGKLVAILLRQYGLKHLDNVMDVVQDTFETAIVKWRFTGLPDQPLAWLIKVAGHKMSNVAKRANKMYGADAIPDQAYLDADMEIAAQELEDSQLQLLLICCQPQLSATHQIMITLHTLCGFGIPELANALLMTTEAVKKAITRTKAKLQQSKIVFDAKNNLDKKMDTVHTILYLMFNEGYKTTRNEKGINIDLCYEAIRLTKLLLNETKATTANALLALMFFAIARFPSRATAENEWLTLAQQDRSLWNKTYIEEGLYYLKQAKTSIQVSPFYIEALIAAIHCTTAKFEQTDWPKIVTLYAHLERLSPTAPLVKLNGLIARSYMGHSSSLIEELDQLEHAFKPANKFAFYLSKAYLYAGLNELDAAKQNYVLALDLAKSPLDRAFVLQKLA